MIKDNVDVITQKCTECACCQMICSITYAGSFNPEEARIIIKPPDQISFTDDCILGCSLCTKYCVYGAIVKAKE